MAANLIGAAEFLSRVVARMYMTTPVFECSSDVIHPLVQTGSGAKTRCGRGGWEDAPWEYEMVYLKVEEKDND